MVSQKSLFRLKIRCQQCEHHHDSSSSSSIVQFSIHPASKHNHIWFRASNKEILDAQVVPITGPVAQVHQLPLTYDTSYPGIHDMLSDLHVDSTRRDWFTSEIIKDTANIVNMGSQVGHMSWVVTVVINIKTMIYVKENELIDQVMFDNTGDFSDNCVICLEELPVGSHANRMVCSHAFHPDCIFMWLSKSRSCPVCRFQMPI